LCAAPSAGGEEECQEDERGDWQQIAAGHWPSLTQKPRWNQ
jgi:hypothetical protein